MSLFKGLSAFPITPADASGRVDTDALATLLKRIESAGADSIALLGSTGAYAFLQRDERKRAVETAMKTVGGKIPVIVGVGALRTDEAQALARDAKAAGVDGLLLAPVSYTPLFEDEVYEHFSAVADSGGLPLCIYNNPGTSKFTFTNALISRLAEVPNVAAIKMPLPAGRDFGAELADLRSMTPPSFSIGYSGDWGSAAALLAGADAWYSVVGGLLPSEALADNPSEAAEAEHTARIREAFSGLSVWIDVKNQARVHSWYEAKFGYSIDPYTSTAGAITTFPTTAAAVGLRPGHANLELCAPYGLSDLFSAVVRPNKKQITREIYEKKVNRWTALWPELKIVGWDQ